MSPTCPFKKKKRKQGSCIRHISFTYTFCRFLLNKWQAALHWCTFICNTITQAAFTSVFLVPASDPSVPAVTHPDWFSTFPSPTSMAACTGWPYLLTPAASVVWSTPNPAFAFSHSSISTSNMASFGQDQNQLQHFSCFLKVNP